MELNAIKRKMECCCVDEKKRQKPDQFDCHYCECTFENETNRDKHVRSIHRCSICHDIVLTNDGRAIHDLRHNQEAQLEDLNKQRQQKLDDDFVLCYLKANKLNEYRSQPNDHKPDFYYIFREHQFEKEELVRFVKKFKREFLDALHIYDDDDEFQYDVDDLIYLVENDALSIKDMADFLDDILFGPEDYVSQLLAYLLEKDYPIKAAWVATVINDDELIERIKAKHTFRFDEICDESAGITFYDQYEYNDLVLQVHRHFPDPDFEEHQKRTQNT